MPEDLRGVGDMLLRAMRDVEAGDLKPEQANSLANLARSYVTIYDAGAAESRLARIEDAIAEDMAG